MQCRRPWFNSWVGKIRWRRNRLSAPLFMGFPCGSAGKESACNAGGLGLIPGLGRFPGEGKGYPLQYSGLENSMDHIVLGVAKRQTWLSDFHFRWNVPMVSLILLKRSLVFPILLFSSVCCCCCCTDLLGGFSYLSLLSFGTLPSGGHMFAFLLCLAPLFFSQLFVGPTQTAVLSFCICFSWGWFWSPSMYNVTNLCL